MELIQVFISAFFLNYMICWIMNLLGKGTYKNKFIVIIIVDLLIVANNLFTYISILTVIEEKLPVILSLVFSVIGVAAGFIVTLCIINDGTSLFHISSKREKAFKKGARKNNEDVMLNSGTNAIVFAIGFVLSLAALGYFIWKSPSDLFYIVLLSVISIACLVLAIVSFFQKSKSFMLILLIETEDGFRGFQKLINPKVTKNYKDCFMPLSRAYIVKPYGEVNYDANHHLVFGLSTDILDTKLVNELPMDKLEFSFYNKVKGEFDGKKLYRLTLDDFFNVSSKEEIKTLKA